ncbi:MAG: class I SAM-dependent methyltransferase [Chloroflexi bacterium]|nr:MAG: class I SAM-dependent methyltransferase [Chloroflexota bacterium]
MDYFQAASAAPPGWQRYSLDDVDRLPAQYLADVPSGEREAAGRGDAEAAERLRRALFWPMLYELEPELWDAISQAEPIHPGILAKLEIDGRRVLEVAAGSGRLTVYLCPRAAELVCVEPSMGLRRILASRCPSADIRAGFFHALPIVDGWADLTVCSASLQPDTDAVGELERATAPGGKLVLISPDSPDWFETRGWERLSFDPAEVAINPHDPELEAIVGPLDPPHELLWRMS